MAVIEVEELTKTFDSFVAVNHLTFRIEEGEVFGLLGPNGAGKTTTIRMLAGLISPSGGTANVKGYSIGGDSLKVRETVGILTENPSLYERLTAYENMDFFAEAYGLSDPQKKQTRIKELLEFFGLWERRQEKVGSFSKGMKQKLAIARALLHEPRLLFLDEPTAGLDPEASRLVRDFIAELRKEGRTIFMCTHNLDEADRLCDRIAVFKTRLLVVDTPASLRSQLFGRKVVFHLRSLDPDLASKVRSLSFVTETRVVENKLLVTLDDPEAHNPQIVRLLVEAGADVQFVGELRHSLEDVYMQLVKNA